MTWFLWKFRAACILWWTYDVTPFQGALNHADALRYDFFDEGFSPGEAVREDVSYWEP